MNEEWDEAAFQKRVRARLAVIGKSATGAMRDVGEAEWHILKSPKNGRRIDSFIKIARALDWTLAELLGVEPPGRADPRLLEYALTIAQERIPRRLFGAANRQAVAEAAATVYEFLAGRVARGEPVYSSTDARALADSLVGHVIEKRRRDEPRNNDQGNA